MDQSLNYLIGVAWDAKIGLQFCKLSPTTPSVASVDQRLIILNTNWYNQKELSFQLAHEIAHILNQDSGILYYTTAVNHSKIEGCANVGAIKLLIPFYFDNCENNLLNVDNFMENFAIPGYLRDKCIDLIKQYSEPDGAFS